MVGRRPAQAGLMAIKKMTQWPKTARFAQFGTTSCPNIQQKLWRAWYQIHWTLNYEDVKCAPYRERTCFRLRLPTRG
jgi:hypothetical protein